jgi:hypothetical protein
MLWHNDIPRVALNFGFIDTCFAVSTSPDANIFVVVNKLHLRPCSFNRGGLERMSVKTQSRRGEDRDSRTSFEFIASTSMFIFFRLSLVSLMPVYVTSNIRF